MARIDSSESKGSAAHPVVTCTLDVDVRIVAGRANGDVMRTSPIVVQVALYDLLIRTPDIGVVVMAVHPVAANNGNDDRGGTVKRNSRTKGTVHRDGTEHCTKGWPSDCRDGARHIPCTLWRRSLNLRRWFLGRTLYSYSRGSAGLWPPWGPLGRLGTFFRSQTPVLGIPVVLLFAQGAVAQQAIGAWLPGALPFQAMLVTDGHPLPALFPVVSAGVLAVLFAILAVWFFQHHEL